MKKKKQTIIYLLGFMLMLNSCGNTECFKNHLDKGNLKLEKSSDDKEDIKEENVYYSLRERFLKNNRIVEVPRFGNNFFVI